ncbi:hypothetical protein ACVBEG_26765 [Pseudomonas sp. GG8]
MTTPLVRPRPSATIRDELPVDPLPDGDGLIFKAPVSESAPVSNRDRLLGHGSNDILELIRSSFSGTRPEMHASAACVRQSILCRR